ncbi:unnamed protein product [Tuber melanosporum]|uniref:(Perigord truffle) hypothetical protein n=1 Tax=Tuber melanosporum (strain Mel28) TaxID=656061 RepID=D5GJQ1_TUBMM|nr:unnamed protein product [Tuber melanosporum]
MPTPCVSSALRSLF